MKLQGSTRLRRALAAGLATGAIVLGACGGGDDPAEPGAEKARSEAPAKPVEGADRGGSDDRAVSETSRSQSNQDGKADAKTKGEPGAAPATAPGGSAPGAGSITPQRSGGGKASGRSGKGEKGSGVKKGSGKAKGTKGPKVAGADPPKTSVAEDPIYAMARGICDDRALIDSLPEDYPRDAETLANLARQFAPPGKEKEAYEGCLAGLRSLGL